MKNILVKTLCKIALVLTCILALSSCSKEDKKPNNSTPVSGSYNIKLNETIGIKGLLTEAQIVAVLEASIPKEFNYQSGQIIVTSSVPKLVLQYISVDKVPASLSVVLVNTDGNLIMTDKAELMDKDGKTLSTPTVTNKTDYVGHVTLLR